MNGFTIDTNKYSGNFERQMCAFITGRIGECEVGTKEQNEYLKIHSPIKNVIRVADDRGCRRPVEIETTPGIWNNGLGFYFKDGEEKQALLEYRRYVRKDKEKWILIVEGHRGKNVPTWTDEAIDRTIKGYKEEIMEAYALTEVRKWPAYQSVRIHFSDPPTKEDMIIMMTRAYEFAKEYGKGLRITGFRVLLDDEYISMR